jgi:hypothetical protein
MTTAILDGPLVRDSFCRDAPFEDFRAELSLLSNLS